MRTLTAVQRKSLLKRLEKARAIRAAKRAADPEYLRRKAAREALQAARQERRLKREQDRIERQRLQAEGIELDPDQQQRLDQLFAWCDKRDQEYTGRKARGDFEPQKVPFYRDDLGPGGYVRRERGLGRVAAA